MHGYNEFPCTLQLDKACMHFVTSTIYIVDSCYILNSGVHAIADEEGVDIET